MSASGIRKMIARGWEVRDCVSGGRRGSGVKFMRLVASELRAEGYKVKLRKDRTSDPGHTIYCVLARR